MSSKIRELYDKSLLTEGSDEEKEARLIYHVAKKRLFKKQHGKFAVGSNFIGKITKDSDRADIIRLLKSEYGIYSVRFPTPDPQDYVVTHLIDGNIITFYGFTVQDEIIQSSSTVAVTNRVLVLGNGQVIDGGSRITTRFSNSNVKNEYLSFIEDTTKFSRGYIPYLSGVAWIQEELYATETRVKIQESPLLSQIPVIYNQSTDVSPDLYLAIKNSTTLLFAAQSPTLFDYSLFPESFDVGYERFVQISVPGTSVGDSIEFFNYPKLNYDIAVQKHLQWLMAQNNKVIDSLNNGNVPSSLAYQILKKTPSSIFVGNNKRWVGYRVEESVTDETNKKTIYKKVYAKNKNDEEVLICDGYAIMDYLYGEAASVRNRLIRIKYTFYNFQVDYIDGTLRTYMGGNLDFDAINKYFEISYRNISEVFDVNNFPVDAFVVNGTFTPFSYTSESEHQQYYNTYKQFYIDNENTLTFSPIDTSELKNDSYQYKVDSNTYDYFPTWFGKGVSVGDKFYLFLLNYIDNNVELGMFIRGGEFSGESRIINVRVNGFYKVTYLGGANFHVDGFDALVDENGDTVERVDFPIYTQNIKNAGTPNVLIFPQSKNAHYLDVETFYKLQRFSSRELNEFINSNSYKILSAFISRGAFRDRSPFEFYGVDLSRKLYDTPAYTANDVVFNALLAYCYKQSVKAMKR